MVGGDFPHGAVPLDGPESAPGWPGSGGRGSALWSKGVFVKPRPHLAKWVQAVLAQMRLEGAGKVLLTCVAQREKVAAGRNVCEVVPSCTLCFTRRGGGKGVGTGISTEGESRSVQGRSCLLRGGRRISSRLIKCSS